jgi:pantetheine-phosphate adenylyltransferase
MSHCLVAGSYDPFTNGHAIMVKQALKLFERVDVIVAANPAKKYYLGTGERVSLVQRVLVDEIPNDYSRVQVVALGADFLVNHAADVGATHIVRGLRNGMDFEYEHNMQVINQDINPDIATVYVSCPPDLQRVSSSMVKGLIGYPGWEKQVGKYVNEIVLKALIQQHISNQIMRSVR